MIELLTRAMICSTTVSALRAGRVATMTNRIAQCVFFMEKKPGNQAPNAGPYQTPRIEYFQDCNSGDGCGASKHAAMMRRASTLVVRRPLPGGKRSEGPRL